MRLHWTGKAVSDLGRLHDFLAPVSPRAAADTIQALARAPLKLLERPRLGTRLETYDDREVRRIFVGDYELRYEIAGDTIYVLRLWHGREDR
ncbi:MAG: type II toxin-antitoxin system RelE/ParE family toxin [Parcubacteria group bacterium]